MGVGAPECRQGPGSWWQPKRCATPRDGKGIGLSTMEYESLPASSTHVLFLVLPYLLDHFHLLANAVRVNSVLLRNGRCRQCLSL